MSIAHCPVGQGWLRHSASSHCQTAGVSVTRCSAREDDTARDLKQLHHHVRQVWHDRLAPADSFSVERLALPSGRLATFQTHWVIVCTREDLPLSAAQSRAGRPSRPLRISWEDELTGWSPTSRRHGGRAEPTGRANSNPLTSPAPLQADAQQAASSPQAWYTQASMQLPARWAGISTTHTKSLGCRLPLESILPP